MFLRKIGKTLLGKATPFHLVASCMIGAWLGFAPGFAQAPALWIVLIATACILPVNIGLVSLTALVTYVLSLLLAPVSFHVGRFLLDGPTGPLFALLINAPFFALMGFEYYTGTGGLLVGGVCGFAAGWGMVKLVRRIRRGIQEMDKNSDRYRRWLSKKSVRFGFRLLLGISPSAATYEKLEGRRIGMPVRPAGVVVAIVLVAGFVWLGHQLSGPVLTRALRAGLERANGATVDLTEAEIRLDEASVVIDGLAMADPNALGTDLLRGLKLEADIGVGDLLTRRFRVDKLIISQASSGEQRKTPGRLVGTGAGPQDVAKEKDEKTLDDYLEDAKTWRERLGQVQRWLDRLSGEPDPGDDKARGGKEREGGLRERLERWARERGYRNVTAEHLITGAPRLSIGELRIEGLKAMQVNGKPFDIVGENLSTHPHLADEQPRLSVRARDGSFVFDLTMGAVSRGGGENQVELVYKGLPADAIGKRLKVSGQAPLQGGTIDFTTRGSWQAGGLNRVDLPFNVVLNKVTLAVAGRAEKIDHLELPLRVYGPLGDPRVLFRQEDLAQSLLGAGKKKLVSELEKQLPKDVGDKLKDVGGLLDKFGGKKKKKDD